MRRNSHGSWWRTPTGVTVIGFALILAFFVLREHFAHALGLLPYALLLACPLLHLFMHGGHGRHGDHWRAAPEDRATAREPRGDGTAR